MPAIKSRYIPALDGLRAFAVLAVIFYHMGLSWAPGGMLGVTIFFVLSGYLITSLLLIEWNNTRTINLPQFWLRRVRRLMPAIVFVIIGTAALCTIFDHSLLTKLREDMWAALLWVTNWWYILHDVSYFDALGQPSPLTHFWSLAIEEQFYLFWPVLLYGAHKAKIKRSTMRNITFVLALLSAGEMALLYDPSGDPSRVYYGTDTRAFSLFIGAWLAFVWPSHLLSGDREVNLTKKERFVFDGVAGVALAILVVLVLFVDGYSSFWYYGGTLLASILTAILIAVIVHPASTIGRLASHKYAVWIGKRSYGMYLWHYPILLLIIPQSFNGDIPLWVYPLELVVIFAISAFSYHFVENPIRKGAIGKLIKSVKEQQVSVPQWIKAHAVKLALGVALCATALGGLIFVSPTTVLEGADLLKEEGAQTSDIEGALAANDTGTDEQPVLDILMIGDSVSVRAIPYFEEAFPYGAIDAAVSRPLTSGDNIYSNYDKQDIVGDIVVFALGTNGPASDETVDELVGSVPSDKQVFLVNTRSTQSWVDTTNSALSRATERYDNVTIIDWYSASASNSDYFDGDGTHLSEEGAQAYIDLIYNAVESYLPEHEEGDEVIDTQTTVEKAADDIVSAAYETVEPLAEKIARSIVFISS